MAEIVVLVTPHKAIQVRDSDLLAFTGVDGDTRVFCDLVSEFLKSHGLDCPVIVSSGGLDVRGLDETEMNRLGWYRRA